MRDYPEAAHGLAFLAVAIPYSKPLAVTKEIFEQVASAFDGESLGELNVKGKGEVFVFGLRSHKK